MKRVLLLFLLVFSLSNTFSQTTYPITQTIGAPQTLVVSKGGFRADSSLIMPSFLDTSAANRSPYIKRYPGNLIWASNQVWVRNSDTTKWLLLAVSGTSSGTVTAISSGYGILNSPSIITSTGSVRVDTATLSLTYVRLIDTSGMLSKYLRKTDTASLSNRINLKLNIADTGAMLSPYLRKVDTSSLSNRINLKLNISDTANKWVNRIEKNVTKDSIIFYIGSTRYAINDSIGKNGTVTAISSGYGISNNPSIITSTGSVVVDTSVSGLSGKYVRVTDTANRWVNNITRVPGKDSIIFFIGSNRYAIKDSSGGAGTVTRAVDTLYRTIGKDSIQFKINGVYYAIKDSSGGAGTVTRAVDTIYRTPGKDSIIFTIAGIRRAIKDSIGNGSVLTGASSFGSFYDSTSQTIASITTAYPIKITKIDTARGFRLENNKIIADSAGVYNLQWSGQFQNTDNAEQDVTVWIRKNGADVVGSAGFVSVPKTHGSGTGIPGHIIASWNYIIPMAAGDSIVFYWQANNTGVSLQYYPQQTNPTRPSTASVIVTITPATGGSGGGGGGTVTKAVDTMYRIPGRDSIIFTINNKRYAIKDSLSSLQSYGNTGAMLYNQSGSAYGNDSLHYSESDNRLFVDAGLTIDASKGKNDTKGIVIDNLLQQNNYNHVLAYDNQTGMVGYKPFSATSAGVTDNIQFKAQAEAGGGFQASSDFVYTASENAGNTKRLGVGTSSPETKLDVIKGTITGGMNRGFYETASFSRNGDNKIGIYNGDNYNGTGSSISFGNIKNKNSLNYYPGFEFQNVNDSEAVANSFMRYNFTQRDSTGQVLDAGIDLMNIYADGKVVINGNGTYSSIGVTPRLVIGTSDNETALEVSSSNASHLIASFTNPAVGITTQIGAIDENPNAGYTATKGSIVNSPDGLYENLNGVYKYRKMTRPYRSYVAQLSQSGTTAPVANILENDLGYTPTWYRDDVGYYHLSSTELSDDSANKVVVFINAGGYPSSLVEGNRVNATWDRDAKTIYVVSSYFSPDIGGTNVPGFVADDNILSDGDDFNRTSIEIRIYD